MSPERGLFQFWEQAPDPRGRQGQRLRFPPCRRLGSVRCGARVPWLHLPEPRTWHLPGLGRRPPTWFGFRKVLMQVDPDARQQILSQWLSALGLTPSDQDLPAVALDGKVLRGTKSRHARGMTLLAFLDQQTGCILSQTPPHESTHESQAALEFLKPLVLKGKLIVGDAAFCRRDVCAKILEGGGG